MKSLFAALFVAFASSSAFADDMSDTKKAFAMLLEYQKTNDQRTPDCYSNTCVVTYGLSSGEKEMLTAVPSDAFIDWLKKEIAKKKGHVETNQDVKYSPETAGIRVAAKVSDPKSGGSGTYSVLYSRDSDGVLRIHEFKRTIELARLPAFNLRFSFAEDDLDDSDFH